MTTRVGCDSRNGTYSEGTRKDGRNKRAHIVSTHALWRKNACEK